MASAIELPPTEFSERNEETRPRFQRSIVKVTLGLLLFVASAAAFIALSSKVTVPELVPLSRVATLPHSAQLDKHHVDHRLILVGDVHGMYKELRKLLKKVKYNRKKDTVVFLGDMVTKGYDSLGVVDFAIEHGAYCVRGNHEDEIMSIYAREHHLTAPRTFPPHASASTLTAGDRPTATLDATIGPTLNKAAAMPTGKLAKRSKAGGLDEMPHEELAEEWETYATNFESEGEFEEEFDEQDEDDDMDDEEDIDYDKVVAKDEERDKPLVRKMKKRHINYLAACPAILKLGQVSRRGIEAVAVHGGLMWNEHELEMQNITDVLRVRSIVPPDYTYGSEDPDDGEPWFDRWNEEQRTRPKSERYEVFYGHDASKGLQLRRYSKGLDTRCQRGGKLSAYVVRVKHNGKFDEELVQIKC